MSLDDVLNHAADEIERWPDYKVKQEIRGAAGPAVYSALFESAVHLYVWPAIQHLQKHLAAELRSGQIQHWRETDRARVVEVLRKAAKEPADSDLEVETLRSKLAEFHMSLAVGMGWLGYNVSTLVRETVGEVGRLRRANERLERELADERRQRIGVDR
jgi:hypothetical protein